MKIKKKKKFKRHSQNVVAVCIATALGYVTFKKKIFSRSFDVSLVLLNFENSFLLLFSGFLEWHWDLQEQNRARAMQRVSILIPVLMPRLGSSYSILRWKHVVVKSKDDLFPLFFRCITFEARTFLFPSTKNILRLPLLLQTLERRSHFMSCDIRAWLRFFSVIFSCWWCSVIWWH